MDVASKFGYKPATPTGLRFLMNAVSFRKCTCGLELKLLQELDLKKQVYTCSCGQRFDFLGTVIEIYTAPAGTGFNRGAEWKPVIRQMKAAG